MTIFTVTQCCCPQQKSLFLSARTNLQVLVLEHVNTVLLLFVGHEGP